MTPQNIKELQTTDIESEEKDVFERKKNFDEIQWRFNLHQEHSLFNTKGNDFRYNVYLRKMKKLAMSWYGGIDLEGYTEYLNNLVKIADFGPRFNIENLKLGEMPKAPQQEIIQSLGSSMLGKDLSIEVQTTDDLQL